MLLPHPAPSSFYSILEVILQIWQSEWFQIARRAWAWQFGPFGESCYVVTISAPHKLQRFKKSLKYQKASKNNSKIL